ncbi:hypothetical protein CCR75_004983 [Bremia lactucae]|uniref:Uncharacterized protein n=1 Tax=Bremia lactucae TaxID=4779 RepID=A0A976FQ50_BRELC|nr:hypothetical protein CCR75_004983 [Bremia lactucae]
MAIIEKEAYAIAETCKRANYLVYRPDGFTLHDHRNSRYIITPTTVSSAVPEYTADKKLHR